MLTRLLERIELWIRHRARRMPYTTYCYYCNVAITAPNEEIFEALQVHFNTPAHQRAAERTGNKEWGRE